MGTGRILIVDDDEALLETTQALLLDEGYEVQATSDPLAVPRLLRKHPPNLVLVDVDMPALPGSHLSRMYHGAYEQTLFVLFSGRPETELRDFAREYGAVGYIQKGCAPSVLLRRVDDWLQRGARG